MLLPANRRRSGSSSTGSAGRATCCRTAAVLCLAGGLVEPVVPADRLARARSAGDDVERFRPLLPVGYAAGVRRLPRRGRRAHRRATSTTHYTARPRLVPRRVRAAAEDSVLEALTGGAWDLSRHFARSPPAATSTSWRTWSRRSRRASASRLFPGDWFGFRVGCDAPESDPLGRRRPRPRSRACACRRCATAT